MTVTNIFSALVDIFTTGNIVGGKPVASIAGTLVTSNCVIAWLITKVELAG